MQAWQIFSGKYTICSISPDVFDRTDVIPVVVLFGGAGGFEKGLPGKKGGKHLVVAVSIEGDAITAQAHRLNNPKVPMHQLMMANHEEVLTAVERYLPRAFWSKSWWHASPSCKKGSCANYGQSPAEVKNWFKTANWTVALLKKSGCPVWTLENTVRLL